MTQILKKSKWVTKQNQHGVKFYVFEFANDIHNYIMLKKEVVNNYTACCSKLAFNCDFKAENLETAQKIALQKLKEYLQQDIDKKTAIKDLISSYC